MHVHSSSSDEHAADADTALASAASAVSTPQLAGAMQRLAERFRGNADDVGTRMTSLGASLTTAAHSVASTDSSIAMAGAEAQPVSVLAGALNAADVIDVADDADSLRSAAQRFSAAAEGVLSAATSGSITWSGLPAVFTSDALQPASLADGPGAPKAKQIQTAADEFLQVASIAANRIEDLKHDHDVLVRQIEQFHAPLLAESLRKQQSRLRGVTCSAPSVPWSRIGSRFPRW